jgi:hypothetical protein
MGDPVSIGGCNKYRAGLCGKRNRFYQSFDIHSLFPFFIKHP